MSSKPISGGQVLRLTGLIMRSSLSVEEHDDLLEMIPYMAPYDVPDLVIYLEMHQLDITQLYNYTKEDISKRLDYLDKKENQ